MEILSKQQDKINANKWSYVVWTSTPILQSRNSSSKWFSKSLIKVLIQVFLLLQRYMQISKEEEIYQELVENNLSFDFQAIGHCLVWTPNQTRITREFMHINSSRTTPKVYIEQTVIDNVRSLNTSNRLKKAANDWLWTNSHCTVNDQMTNRTKKIFQSTRTHSSQS